MLDTLFQAMDKSVTSALNKFVMEAVAKIIARQRKE